MNRIITTDVLDPSIQQPFTARSLDFLEDATKDMILGIVLSQIGDAYDNTKAYVIKGLSAYGTNQYHDGYVLWGGELYYSTGKVSVTAFSNVPVMTLTVTNDGTADPVEFTDGISRNVHNVRRMVLSDAVSGTGTFDLGDALYINDWIAASTPTLSAYDTSDVLVVGGVTPTGVTYAYRRTANGVKINFVGTVDTTATTARIQMTLPFSIPTYGNITSARGFGACRFYKSGTGGIPTFCWIELNSSGAGTGLSIEKYDGTAFGVLTGYLVKFVIDIEFLL